MSRKHPLSFLVGLPTPTYCFMWHKFSGFTDDLRPLTTLFASMNMFISFQPRFSPLLFFIEEISTLIQLEFTSPSSVGSSRAWGWVSDIGPIPNWAFLSLTPAHLDWSLSFPSIV